MKIKRSLAVHGNLFPSVYGALRLAPESAMHFLDHDLRHPLGIYNVSIGRVLSAFEGVLTENDRIQSALFNSSGQLDIQGGPLVEALAELLESMLAHTDDCYHILKTFHPPVTPRKPPAFAQDWLEAVKDPAVKGFRDAIREHRDAIAAIVNRMKHSHARLCTIVFHGNGPRIVGYFLEGVDKRGSLGPDPVLHPGNTAISLHRDLRLHLFRLYMIGHYLKTAVLKDLEMLHHTSLDGALKAEDSSERVVGVATRVFQLPPTVFPDEVPKPMPYISYSRSDGELTLEFPGSGARTFPGNMQVQVLFNGDGVTRSFRLPYWQPRGAGSGLPAP